jgi:hypothetical protein
VDELESLNRAIDSVSRKTAYPISVTNSDTGDKLFSIVRDPTAVDGNGRPVADVYLGYGNGKPLLDTYPTDVAGRQGFRIRDAAGNPLVQTDDLAGFGLAAPLNPIQVQPVDARLNPGIIGANTTWKYAQGNQPIYSSAWYAFSYLTLKNNTASAGTIVMWIAAVGPDGTTLQSSVRSSALTAGIGVSTITSAQLALRFPANWLGGFVNFQLLFQCNQATSDFGSDVVVSNAWSEAWVQSNLAML